MPKTVEIRDLDDDVYAAPARRATEASTTVAQLLRREAVRLAARPAPRLTISEWLPRTRRAEPSTTSRSDVLQTLDEIRGPWPEGPR